MITILCDFCGEIIPASRFAARKQNVRKHDIHFCNRDCQVEYHKAIGHYKKMSIAGKPGRLAHLSQRYGKIVIRK